MRVSAALEIRFNDANGFAGPGTMVTHEENLTNFSPILGCFLHCTQIQ